MTLKEIRDACKLATEHHELMKRAFLLSPPPTNELRVEFDNVHTFTVKFAFGVDYKYDSICNSTENEITYRGEFTINNREVSVSAFKLLLQHLNKKLEWVSQ